MNVEEKPKSHKRLRIGALILIILIVIILFKVNLRKTVESPTFQSNVTYIQEKSEIFFEKYIKEPILKFWDSMFKLKTPKINDATIDKKIQPDKIKNYFNITSEEKVNQFSSPIAN